MNRPRYVVRERRIIAFLGFLLIIGFSLVSAAGAQAQIDTTKITITERTWETAGLRLGYLSFSNESMKAAYDNLLISTFEGTLWILRGSGAIGLGAELGWAEAEGRPELMESTWNVSDSWVKVKALNFGLNFFYAFMNPSPASAFMPYVGLCPALWVGTERISTDADRLYRGIEEAFGAELLAIGFAYGGHAVVGSSIAVGGGVRALIEARWTQSSGSLTDMSEEEEKEGYESTLYDAVKRTDFNFTGWRIDIGVEW